MRSNKLALMLTAITGLTAAAVPQASAATTVEPLKFAVFSGVLKAYRSGDYSSSYCAETVTVTHGTAPLTCSVVFRLDNGGLLNCDNIGDPTTTGSADYTSHAANVTVLGTPLRGTMINGKGHLRGTIIDTNPTAPVKALTIDISISSDCQSETEPLRSFVGYVSYL